MQEKWIEQFNQLGIADMSEVNLNRLRLFCWHTRIYSRVIGRLRWLVAVSRG